MSSRIKQLSVFLAFLTLSSLDALPQTRISLDRFDETEIPEGLTIKEQKTGDSIERIGIDSTQRVYFEMTVDTTGQLLQGTSVRKYVYDSDGNYIIMLQSADGESLTHPNGAHYCFIVPGPSDRFVRKAWLDADGIILEEERRSYDQVGRLVSEGYVDPVTGSYTLEYRHRYSSDGKTQFTAEFTNGIQQGPELSSEIE